MLQTNKKQRRFDLRYIALLIAMYIGHDQKFLSTQKLGIGKKHTFDQRITVN